MRTPVLAQCLAIVLAVASLTVTASARGSPVGPPSVQGSGFIGGSITETAVDWDGNGLTDAVNLSVPVTLNTTAHWRLSGYLGANGTSIYDASEFYRGPGTYPVTLSFAGWIWRLSRANGSFSGPLYLIDLDNSDSFTLNYTTAVYVWTTMELRAELAGGYTTQPIDANADGFYDYLEITGRLHVGAPGPYYLTIYLDNANGTSSIAVGFNRSVYAPGYTNYHVWLDGNAIRQGGIDGPYRVDVWLCFSLECLMPSEADTFLTSAYAAASFAHQPIAFRGNPTDRGVDTDGNGKFEFLRVDLPVNVTIAGVYNLTSNLYGPFGFGTNGWTSVYLAAGNQTVSLDFPGWPFRTNLEDGPFTVQLFLRENISTYQIGTSHTTAAYTWNEFDSPFGLFGPVTIVPVDTDGNGLYNVVDVNFTIDAKVAADFQVQLTVIAPCCGSPPPADQTVAVRGGPGPIPLSLVVPGWELRAWMVNGTYGFSLVLRIMPLAVLDDIAGAQVSFNWTKFDPAIALRGPIAIHPVDTDGDGHWNRLEADVPLQVLVAGSYGFTFNAFNSTCPLSCATSAYRTLTLAPGSFDLNFSVSGLDLRQFLGDATLHILASLQSTTVLDWTGRYAIPDPAVFQSLPVQSVTFHVQTPQTGPCCATIFLVNYSNAYVHYYSGYGPDPSTITVVLPVQNYTVLAEGTSGLGQTFEALTLLSTPLPGTLDLSLTAVGLVTDATQLRFADWSTASLLQTRTQVSNPAARFMADLWDQPDGYLAEAEIFNWFASWVFGALPPTGLRLDDRSLPLSQSGPDYVLGAGPVVGGPDLGYAHPLAASGSPSSSLVHVVGLNLTKADVWTNATAEIRVPDGWTVSGLSAPPGSVISGIGTGDVQVTLPAAFAGTGFVNVTATWASYPYLPSVVSGTVVGTGRAPLQGAAASLWHGASQTNASATDVQGHFAFGSVVPGTYALRVQTGGYLPYEANVTVRTNEVLDVGTISLTSLPATGGLTGRVTDVEGSGIASASMRLVEAARVVASAASNATGFFAFSDIPPGSYRLLVDATGFVSANLSVTILGSQVSDLGSVVLNRLPVSTADLSWVPWVSAVAVVVAVGVLVAWTLLRNRRKAPPSSGGPETSDPRDGSLK